MYLINVMFKWKYLYTYLRNTWLKLDYNQNKNAPLNIILPQRVQTPL